MKTAVIVDISPFIYAGSVNKSAYIEGDFITTGSSYSVQRLASGGIAFLFNIVKEYANNSLCIFVGDRNPTVKKTILPNYKLNREYKDSIEVQKQIAEEVLEQSGFNVLYKDGYEADDIIYSVCKLLQSTYDKIYVYTTDSDLFIVVNSKVECRPASSKGKHVTRDNYEVTVSKDRIIKYNSLTFLKFLYGDSSDNYGGIDKEGARRLEEKFLNNTYINALGITDIIQSYIELFAPEYLNNFKIAYPIHIKDIKVDINKVGESRIYNAWGRAVGNRKFSRDIIYPDIVQGTIKRIINRTEAKKGVFE